MLSGANAPRILFRRKDFPVPALPVKNTFLPAITAFITYFCSSVRRRGTKGLGTAITFYGGKKKDIRERIICKIFANSQTDLIHNLTKNRRFGPTTGRANKEATPSTHF